MAYVDGFVIPVPKDKLDAYKDAGAVAPRSGRNMAPLTSVECVGDDVPYGKLTSFPRAVQAKEDEVVVFSWIVYEFDPPAISDGKIMADPRLKT